MCTSASSFKYPHGSPCTIKCSMTTELEHHIYTSNRGKIKLYRSKTCCVREYLTLHILLGGNAFHPSSTPWLTIERRLKFTGNAKGHVDHQDTGQPRSQRAIQAAKQTDYRHESPCARWVQSLGKLPLSHPRANETPEPRRLIHVLFVHILAICSRQETS